MAKLLFSGDFCPNNYILKKDFYKDLVPLVNEHDLHISNLECPITESKSKIMKTGPSLKTNNETIGHLLAIKVRIACMANNHIFDYGKEGVYDTIKLCQQHNIIPIGIKDDNIFPFHSIEINHEIISFVNFCEHEFSVRKTNGLTASGFSYEESFHIIQKLKKFSDSIVAVYHGGNEYYEYPSPGLKKRMQYLADIGCDIIVVHHSHIISGYELYKGKPIFYGIGNFYFPLQNEPDSWYTGMILSIDTQSLQNPNLYFVKQSMDFNSISLLKGKKHEEEMNKVLRISEIISNSSLLENKWTNFVNKNKVSIIKNLLNLGKFKRLLLKIGLITFKDKYTEHNLISLLNLVRCESHREILIHSLSDFITDKSEEAS